LTRCGLGLRCSYFQRFAGREHDILQCSQVWKQIEALKHHAYFSTRRVEISRDYFLPVKNDTALRWRFKVVDTAQKGRFTTAGRPDQPDYLALPDIE